MKIDYGSSAIVTLNRQEINLAIEQYIMKCIPPHAGESRIFVDVPDFKYQSGRSSDYIQSATVKINFKG